MCVCVCVCLIESHLAVGLICGRVLLITVCHPLLALQVYRALGKRVICNQGQKNTCQKVSQSDDPKSTLQPIRGHRDSMRKPIQKHRWTGADMSQDRPDVYQAASTLGADPALCE